MYRIAASRLRSLKDSKFPARFASSICAALKSSSSGGLFSWLTGEKSNSLPPLEIPLNSHPHCLITSNLGNATSIKSYVKVIILG
uniref:Uncharacterized protein n=1 Tax=Manihot esculenta TaxID=3983 RepID=A0A2C9UBN4_MANES